MGEAIKNSIIGRFAAFMLRAARESGLARLGRRMSESYAVSRTRDAVDRFASVPLRAPSSLWGRAADAVSRAADRIRAPFAAAWKDSILYRICCKVRGVLEDSFIARPLVKIGFRRLSIICLSLYVLVDWFLRSVINISALASGWDEALFILLLFYVVFRTPKDGIKSSRATDLGVYIALFCAAGFFLMCAVSPHMSIAVAGYRAEVQYILWFYVMIRLVDDEGDFHLFYASLLALSILMCLHGIYQYIAAVPIPSSWVTHSEMGVRTRVFSITGSPNIFGSFIVMTAPLAAGLIYRFRELKYKIMAWCALGIMALCVLFTYSRGAWVGAVIAVIVFSLLVDKKLIGLMAVAAGGAIAFVPSIANRITYLFTDDYVIASQAGGRMLRWSFGMDLLGNSNRLLGFGLGRFGGAVAMQNQIIEQIDDFEYFYLDNYYLKTLVEMGYLGLGFYLLLLAAFLVLGLRAVLRVRGQSDFPLVCGAFAGLCGVLVHCFFENIFEVPYMLAYFWMIAALIIFRGWFCKGSTPQISKVSG